MVLLFTFSVPDWKSSMLALMLRDEACTSTLLPSTTLEGLLVLQGRHLEKAHIHLSSRALRSMPRV